MTKFRNMKISITEDQPLDDVVKTLETKGHRKFAWSGHENTVCILAYKNTGWISDYNYFVDDIDFVLTTLAELKEMG